MLFKKRKLYKVGNRDSKFLLVQIPTIVCADMNLKKDDYMDIEYDTVNKKIIVKRSVK